MRLYIFPNYTTLNNNNLLTSFTRMGTWFLVFTGFVPISLILTLEMVKFIQAIFISWDADLYCKNTQRAAIVQSSVLNEELGQIQVNIFYFYIINKVYFYRQNRYFD